MNKISVFPTAKPGKDSATCIIMEVENLEKLASIIQNNTWSQTIFKDNYRNRLNFLSADYVSFDIDSGTTIQETLNTLNNTGLSYLLIPSRNHQKIKVTGATSKPACDRFRIVIPLSETITDPATYKSTWSSLSDIIGNVDKQTGNEDRYYYSSGPQSEIYIRNGESANPVYQIARKGAIKDTQSETPKKAVLGVGVLTVMQNIMNGTTDGNWSTPLHNMAKDLARSGMSKEMAAFFAESIAPKAFDSHDWKEFNKGYDKNKDKPLFEAAAGKSKDKMEDYVKFIVEEFDGLYMVKDTTEKSRGHILALNPNNIVHTANMVEIRSKAAELIYMHFGIILSADQIKSIVETWLINASVHKIEPKAVAFKDDPSLTYHRLDFEPEEGEFPLFQEFLDRVHNAEALMAYTWSILETASYQQQYVWIHGSGGEGKSSYIDILNRLLKDAYVASSSDAVSQNDFTASLVGKRLVTFSDTNNPTFTTSGKMKAITGGDIVSVRPLYANRYSVKLNTKVIVCSNYLPEIPNQAADLRRLILCTVQPLPEDTILDPQYSEKLWGEIKAYLYACREMYTKLTKGVHAPIECDLSILGDATYSTEWRMSRLINDHFNVEPESENILTIDEIMSTIHYKAKSLGVTQRDMEQFIKNTLKLEKRRRQNTKGYRPYGYKGLSLK